MGDRFKAGSRSNFSPVKKVFKSGGIWPANANSYIGRRLGTDTHSPHVKTTSLQKSCTPLSVGFLWFFALMPSLLWSFRLRSRLNSFLLCLSILFLYQLPLSVSPLEWNLSVGRSVGRSVGSEREGTDGKTARSPLLLLPSFLPSLSPSLLPSCTCVCPRPPFPARSLYSVFGSPILVVFPLCLWSPSPSPSLSLSLSFSGRALYSLRARALVSPPSPSAPSLSIPSSSAPLASSSPAPLHDIDRHQRTATATANGSCGTDGKELRRRRPTVERTRRQQISGRTDLPSTNRASDVFCCPADLARAPLEDAKS